MNFDGLRTSFSGTILTPEHPGFRPALGPLNADPPAAIASAASEQDVVAAVRFATSNGLGVAVRSGGHAGGMFAPGPDRLLVDLASLDGIVTSDDGLTTIGPGALWGQVAAALASTGHAISSGDTAQVGVGGLALGGGVGLLVRRDGLTVDNVVSARVVTATGEVVTASAQEHPDLFWALKGGGGNFGVVTSFTIQAQPLSGVLHLHAALDPEKMGAFLGAWRDVMLTAPDELNATASVAPGGPPGAPPMHQLDAVWAGEDSEHARAAIAPLLTLPGVLEATVNPTQYADVLQQFAPPPPDAPPMSICGRNTLIADFSDDLIDAVLTARATLGPSVFAVRALGGRYGRVGDDDTALPDREARFLVWIVEFVPAGATPRLPAAWADADVPSANYGNFSTANDEAALAALYPPATMARLRAVKSQYDPQNLFSANLNVLPG